MDLLRNVPQEMTYYHQWVVWKLEQRGEGKPTKVPYSPKTGQLASVNNPHSWGSYKDSINAMFNNHNVYSGIGFVLTENDPYAFIDLDEAQNEEQWQLQQQIFENVPSYSELSPSGKGLHIICRGSLPTGKRKNSVEVYTSQRYMTMTGNVYRNLPIEDHSQTLYSLWEHLGGNESNANESEHINGVEPDQIIIDRAANAENGQLFRDLFVGNWRQHSHKWSDNSQSCADQALINIIQFYTKDHKQIMRIFRQSHLGMRDKAKRDGYLKTCIKKAFDRDYPIIDATELMKKCEEVIEARIKSEKFENGNFNSDLVEKIGLNQNSDFLPGISENENHLETGIFPDISENLNDNHSHSDPFTVPPGLVGEIAQFIYAASPRPVAEIAIGAAIGLMAGICGRAYNTSGMGLNHYVLILASTGTGKEAATSGIHSIMNSVKKVLPTTTEFIGPSTIASQQALIKRLSKSQSFVSILGEFGATLEIMTSRNASPADRGLLKILMDVFNKSGHGQVLGSMEYSDSDKNVQSILSPALSLLAESTGETFYRSIDERNIQSGFVPRFTVIEYQGDRPKLNTNRAKLSDAYELIDKLAKISAHCQMLNQQNQAIPVYPDQVAAHMLDQYNEYVDSQIRGKDEVVRQIWTRAHVKVMKLSALLAVGINPYNPLITKDLVTWAINIENANVKRMLFKFNSNSVGANCDTNETAQMNLLNSAIKDWITRPYEELSKYKAGNADIHRLKVIPYKFLLLRLSSQRAYSDDRIGANNAIRRNISALVDSGDLIETIDQQQFGTRSKMYAVSNPAHFI